MNLSAAHLLSNSPLPPEANETRLPLSALRKSLRLLTEDTEFDNDISYVYSGYAPLSIRLVQCVAQKGSLLNTPPNPQPQAPADGAKANNDDDLKKKLQKVRAHPIVGWKGFEDIVTRYQVVGAGWGSRMGRW